MVFAQPCTASMKERVISLCKSAPFFCAFVLAPPVGFPVIVESSPYTTVGENSHTINTTPTQYTDSVTQERGGDGDI